jgi:methylated-DNA-[protein]-cysteine S-methyltransferase
MAVHHRIIDTPVGELTLVGDEPTLTGIYYPGHWTNPDRSRFGPLDERAFAEVERQLREYFAGDRTTFALDTGAAGTDFQRSVWSLIDAIPYGETATYRQLAGALERPSHPRAIGAAVGANPLSLITPCHRVVGSSGSLTGYAGGLPRKRFLLELEGALPTRLPRTPRGSTVSAPVTS